MKVPVRSLIGEDKYYIKRIVGEPGDRLEMIVPDSIFSNGTDVRYGVPGVLHRNGEPISGCDAFESNNQRTLELEKKPLSGSSSGFPGYRAEGLLSNRLILEVPNRTSQNNPTGMLAFFAMGDNSTNSLDGRAWGFVPEDEIIGKALFIYYPFTQRWGFAQ